MITVKNLTKKFDSFKAVDDISFSVKKGEIVGLLGPNGAGKTTTMRMLTGFLSALTGFTTTLSCNGFSFIFLYSFLVRQ